MNILLTFDDILIKPKFSFIESRKDVELSIKALGLDLKLPCISANMDTITDSKMAIAMAKNGAIGCLHRFWDIQKNVDEFKEVFLQSGHQVMCSIGLGPKELERAEALVSSGCISLVIDVAHGASIGVVKQVKDIRELFGENVFITVGNFATSNSVEDFLEHYSFIDGIKVGIGPGAICKTRMVTGCGYPQLSAIMEISRILKNTDITIIADGGMSKTADCSKALAAGAHILMSGSLFAGCEECPGETVYKGYTGKYLTKEEAWAKKKLENGEFVFMDKNEFEMDLPAFKKYRGSASQESYIDQGKVASHRSPEGETLLVPYKGYVMDVLQEIEAGLRSAFSYTSSKNLKEFHQNAEFVRVSNNTVIENGIRNGVK